jgi:O-antigen/teichoic acid export membrane protein
LNFLQNTLRTFIVQIICVVLGIIGSIIIARILGPESKGYYSLLMLVPSLLIQFGNLGIGVANSYFGGSKKYSFSVLASNSVLVSIILGTMLFGVFLLYCFIFHPAFLSEIHTGHIILVSLVIPASLLKTYFNAIILGQKRIKDTNILAAIQASFSFLLTIIALLVLKIGIIGLIITWILSEVIGTILTFIFVWRVQSFKIFSFYLNIFWDTLKFGAIGYTGNIIQFFNYRLDMLMLASFMTIVQVGYYSVAVSIVEALWYFPASVGLVIFASTTGANIKDSNKTTPIICRNTLFITLVLAIGLFMLSQFLIIFLYGQDYSPAVKPLWILLPGGVAFSICKVLCNEMTGRGKPIINVIASAISLSINIPLNFVLIPRMGMIGAAIATSTSYLVTSIIVLIYFSKLSSNKIIDIVMIKKEDLKLYWSFAVSLRAHVRTKRII